MKVFLFNGTYTKGIFTGLYVKFLFIRTKKINLEIPIFPLGYDRQYGLFLREVQEEHFKALKEFDNKEILH